jgi:hypothetical protein
VFVDTTPDRVNHYIAVLDQSQKILLALSAFITAGLGGLAIAGRKVYRQLRGVEEKVEPVSREITDRGSDTLVTRVDTISERIEHIDMERVQQHQDNSARLDRIEGRMDQMQEDIGGIRRVLDKILVKLAGLQ